MTRASDTARLLGAGATILDGTTITTADNTTQLTLTSTDADASVGPVLDLRRDSSSPADGDAIGRIRYRFDNDNGDEETAVFLDGTLADASDGTEDASFKIQTKVGGTARNRIDITSSEIVINEDSIDSDFRVEGSGSVNAFVIEGSSSNVGIGTNSPDTKLQIKGAVNSDQFTLGGTDSRGLKISTTNVGGQNDSAVIFDAQDTEGSAANSSLIFSTGGSERMRLQDSTFFIKKTTESAATEGVALRPGGGTSNIAVNGGTVFRFCRNTNDGTILSFLQANNTEGTISISGSTTSYNAFSGSHWSRLTDNSKPTILKGTVIETIDEMCDWYRVKFTVKKTDDCEEYEEKISIALPDGKKVGDTISHTYLGITYDNAVIIKEADNKHTKCKISDTADSKRVYGVFADWDNDDDTVNDMYVTAVGTHVVRINKDVTVSAGDLLSSNGDGTAKVQDDDIIRSKTIGKVLTNIKQETYSDGSYTVPCALYCG